MVGSFLFGWPSIIAVIINYVKRGDARGTWLESHFSWQIRTFWYRCCCGRSSSPPISIPLAVIVVGIGTWVAGMFVLGIWAIYRVARGWLRLNNRQPMPMIAAALQSGVCAAASSHRGAVTPDIPLSSSRLPTGVPYDGAAGATTTALERAFQPMSFDHLGLAEPLLRAVREQGYETPTPIQREAIPPCWPAAICSPAPRPAPARPPASCCRCCSGCRTRRAPNATAAAASPIRALILTPTRELAAQVEDSVRTYGKHLHAAAAW